MKTLDEHNKDMIKPNKLVYNAEVTCPHCLDVEMMLVNPHVILASLPPQQTVRCPKCHYIGYKRI